MTKLGGAALYTTTIMTALGFMLIGYDNGVMGGIINGPEFDATFKTANDETLLGTIVAIYEIGCFVGALITSVVGERLGRRRSVMIGALIMLGAAGFQAGVSSSGAMIAARTVSGLGMGFINSTMPVLQSEVSPKAYRGRFVCFQLTLLNLGIMISYWVGYGFTGYVEGSKAWRIPIALQAIFILPICVLVFIVPESPRWLASHGREDEALTVLGRLNGRSVTDPEVAEQYAEIADAVALEKSIGSGTWKDLLREDEIKSRRRVVLACTIQFFQQIGGINGLIFYMGNFFGLVSDKPALLAGGIFVWFFAASFIPWFLIDSIGRRKLFLICTTGMASVYIIETGLIWKVQTDAAAGVTNLGPGIAATAFMFAFMGFFTIGFQANVWCYTTEILPLRLRQKGASLATASNWITNFVIVQINPLGIENLGWRFYIIFSIFNSIFIPVIYFFFPETVGLSLEAVDTLFSAQRGSTDIETKPQLEHLDKVHNEQTAELDDKM